jgi:mono/diheme cytochrome c family protein
MRLSLGIAFLQMFCLAALAAPGTVLPVIPGDSSRGAKLFEAEQCIRCHAVNGRGGKVGLDLGRVVHRNYTPAHLTSAMWNHAPTMWGAMEAAKIETPQLTPQGAADLFAFFYSARFFDKPGESAAGKTLFDTKQCATCHGITDSHAEGATPVAKWESLADPILLVQQMWNHSFRMRQAFARRGLQWQVLTGSELNDILSYLRTLPETNQLGTRFSNTSGAGGEQLFQSKGCVNCHHGDLALENRLKNMTLTDIAVDMWNHAPRMLQTPPVFTQNEMRELLSYLWMRQLVYPGGSIAAGQKVFSEQRCSACHAGGTNGARQLPGQAAKYSEVTIISALWRHGPQMLRRMKAAGVSWPRFNSPQEVADLIAYLNSVQ